MKSNPNKNTTKCNPEEEYDNLLQEFQDMSQPQETIQNGDITSLKGRAKQLLVWITLHKNHVNRHELADICKEGKELIEKIMKSTNNIDTSELDFELMVLEARKTACEEAFAEDLKGFDNITPDIIDSLPPQVQVSIKARISKAKSNIYATIDTPESILDEIEGMHNHAKDSRIDNMISNTLDGNTAFDLLRRSQNIRDGLRKYIRERIDYIGYEALLEQVMRVLNNLTNSIRCSGYQGPSGINYVINQYNGNIDELKQLHYNHVNDFSKISIKDFHPEMWSFDGSYQRTVFERIDREIQEMDHIIIDIKDSYNRIRELFPILKNYRNLHKPAYIGEKLWEKQMERIRKIDDDLKTGKYADDDKSLSKLIDEVNIINAEITQIKDRSKKNSELFLILENYKNLYKPDYIGEQLWEKQKERIRKIIDNLLTGKYADDDKSLSKLTDEVNIINAEITQIKDRSEKIEELLSFLGNINIHRPHYLVQQWDNQVDRLNKIHKEIIDYCGDDKALSNLTEEVNIIITKISQIQERDKKIEELRRHLLGWCNSKRPDYIDEHLWESRRRRIYELYRDFNDGKYFDDDRLLSNVMDEVNKISAEFTILQNRSSTIDYLRQSVVHFVEDYRYIPHFIDDGQWTRIKEIYHDLICSGIYPKDDTSLTNLKNEVENIIYSSRSK